jgi:hypothetical protein
MPPRPHDPSFGLNEKIWRKVNKGDLRGGKTLRTTSLRLQISAVREKHGERASVPDATKTGIMETTAAVVSGVQQDAARVVCVDDPNEDHAGHTLLALVAPPGEDVSQETINAAREQIALKFSLVVAP